MVQVIFVLSAASDDKELRRSRDPVRARQLLSRDEDGENPAAADVELPQLPLPIEVEYSR